MNPIIHPGLTQVKEFAHDRLQRIGLEVDQKKQELILGLLQAPFATPANRTLSRLAFGGLVCGVDLLIRLGEGRQQTLELRERQARESQKLSAVGLECLVCDHAFILFLIPDKVYLVGPLVDDMLRNRSLAESHLGNPDHNIRYVALALLAIEWKPTKRTADFSEQLAIQDPDERMRKAALQALIEFYAGTDSDRIGSVLVKILRTDSESAELRFLAYQGLYQVRGMPIETWPVLTTAPSRFRVPEDVDWAFIDRQGSRAKVQYRRISFFDSGE